MRCDVTSLNGFTFDVAVIGAGINGTGAAALLAERGYSVLLIDKNDVGSGSSSRSSRMLHCGLNYLALAYESPRVRDKIEHLITARRSLKLRKNAHDEMPERVQPTTFFIPIFSDDTISGLKFDLAFGLLSALNRRGPSLCYKRYKESQLGDYAILTHFGPKLVGAVSFSEYRYEWPERVCVDNALRAHAAGAVVGAYVVMKGGRQTSAGWELELSDSSEPARRATVGARLVLNLAGVWADLVAASLNASRAPTVTPNKGCHLAVKLPTDFNGKGIMCRNAIGHIFMCVPWRGLHIIGPTETVHESSPEGVTPTDADIDLLLTQANSVLPRINLRRRDVVFSWAGLRPATFQAGNPRGIWKRVIHDLSPSTASPMLSLSWGRLADHTDSAGRIAEQVREWLGAPPLPATQVANRPLPPDRASLADIISTEGPVTVADVMFRRTGRGWDPDLGLSSLDEVSQALATAHGRLDAEGLKEEYRMCLDREFRCRASGDACVRPELPPV